MLLGTCFRKFIGDLVAPPKVSQLSVARDGRARSVSANFLDLKQTLCLTKGFVDGPKNLQPDVGANSASMSAMLPARNDRQSNSNAICVEDRLPIFFRNQILQEKQEGVGLRERYLLQRSCQGRESFDCSMSLAGCLKGNRADHAPPAPACVVRVVEKPAAVAEAFAKLKLVHGRGQQPKWEHTRQKAEENAGLGAAEAL